MDDLIAWLRLQFDDEEKMLRELLDAPSSVWWKPGDERGPDCLSVEVAGAKRYRRLWSAGGSDEFIEWGWVVAGTALELFSQDQVRERLAEIAAKRRILGLWTGWDQQAEPSGYDGGHAAALDDVIHHLALPYADRPGYRDEWAP